MAEAAATPAPLLDRDARVPRVRSPDEPAVRARAVAGLGAVRSDDPDIPCRGAGVGAARGPSDIQQIGRQGGFTALHYAVRDGYVAAADALLDAGADVNRRSDGDLSTPLVVASINGQYNIAIDLLKHGADPNLPSDDGVAPLFAVLNNEWALRTWYPQPTAGAQQQTSYLQLLEALLKAGADPNQRTLSHIWYASYNTGRMGVDFAGATPFWRAAYSLDVDAMRLLVKYGADPLDSDDVVRCAEAAERSIRLAGRPDRRSRCAAVPCGERRRLRHLARRPAAPPHSGRLDGCDQVLRRGAQGRHQHPRCQRLHGAPSRRGARRQRDDHVPRQTRRRRHGRGPSGQTTVDMANSPEQRTQPFPETIKLLEGMGAKNNHKCQACK